MENIPEELIFEIYKYLEFVDIIRCSSVNKWYQNVVRREYFWYPKIKELYKRMIGNFKPKRMINVYERYIDYQKLILVGKLIFGRDIGKIKSLRRLQHKKNLDIKLKLTKIPQCANILKPENCSIINNDLIEFSDIICQWTNLTSLNISSNKIKLIHPNIGNLNNLVSLNLSNNKLKKLPDEIGSLINLSSLSCNANQLTELPQTISKLISLEYLYIDQNQIAKLPETIGKLINLTHLSCNNNRLTELPQTIGKLSNLTELYLDRNMFKKVPMGLLRELAKLHVLYMQYNVITEVEQVDKKGVKLGLCLTGNPVLSQIPRHLVQAPPFRYYRP